MLSRFEVTRFRLTAGWWKFGEVWGFLRQIFRGGVKNSQVGFQAWPNGKLVCKFRGHPLRDGWDPLSRNLGPKLTDQWRKKYCAKTDCSSSATNVHSEKTLNSVRSLSPQSITVSPKNVEICPEAVDRRLGLLNVWKPFLPEWNLVAKT